MLIVSEHGARQICHRVCGAEDRRLGLVLLFLVKPLVKGLLGCPVERVSV